MKLIKAFLLIITFMLHMKPIICKKCFYFAYGSNLLQKRIRLQNQSAKFLSIAKLHDYRLDFDMHFPLWNGAVATIVKDQGSLLWGSVWILDVNDLTLLDGQEGVSKNQYKRETVSVELKNGTQFEVLVYVGVKTPIKLKSGETLPQERKPSIDYLQVIINGAYESGLPPDYIAKLYIIPVNGKLATEQIRNQLGFHYNQYERQKIDAITTVMLPIDTQKKRDRKISKKLKKQMCMLS